MTRKFINYHASRSENRYWLRIGRVTFRFEGYLGEKAHHTMIGLQLGGEENDATFSLGIKRLFSFWIGFEDLFPRKLMARLFNHETRYYEISAFDEYINFNFHWDEMGYGKGWRGVHKMFNWKDFLFGKQTYIRKTIMEENTYVSMPEGDYPCTVELYVATWKRERFVKPERIIRAEVDMEIPVPIPGKGESDWDIDDDAIFNLTTKADTVQEAVNKVKESATRTREKYGGRNWVPAEGFKVVKK